MWVCVPWESLDLKKKKRWQNHMPRKRKETSFEEQWKSIGNAFLKVVLQINAPKKMRSFKGLYEKQESLGSTEKNITPFSPYRSIQPDEPYHTNVWSQLWAFCSVFGRQCRLIQLWTVSVNCERISRAIEYKQSHLRLLLKHKVTWAMCVDQFVLMVPCCVW